MSIIYKSTQATKVSADHSMLIRNNNKNSTCASRRLTNNPSPCSTLMPENKIDRTMRQSSIVFTLNRKIPT